MKSFINHPKLCVSDGRGFDLKNFPSNEKLAFRDEKKLKAELQVHKDQISELQEKLYAQDRYSVLLVLQAIDAAGKDSCIKHVLSGVNPQGCHVANFGKPSQEELDHDFMWRIYRQLPERGKIGVFNRSHYEEILICKVHPEIILGQQIPGVEKKKDINSDFWKDRYRSINEMERHLVKNGTVIIKVFLNLGKDEQKKRFLERIDEPSKQWKFSFGDLEERKLWNSYRMAYNEMIRNTSTSYAPWYVVPADDQWVSRAIVGRLLCEKLSSLNLAFPETNDDVAKKLTEAGKQLMNER